MKMNWRMFVVLTNEKEKKITFGELEKIDAFGVVVMENMCTICMNRLCV